MINRKFAAITEGSAPSSKSFVPISTYDGRRSQREDVFLHSDEYATGCVATDPTIRHLDVGPYAADVIPPALRDRVA